MGFVDQLIELIFGKQYGKKVKTIKGETVKSTGEQILADYFYYNDIDYQYERTVRTVPYIGKKISKPDFYLPKYKVYVEYWGLANVNDMNKQQEYRRSMDWKQGQYKKFHVTYISIFPTDLHNIDFNIRQKVNEVLGYELPVSNKPVFDTSKYFSNKVS